MIDARPLAKLLTVGTETLIPLSAILMKPKKARVDSTGERNMIDFMLFLEGSRWHNWVDRVYPRSKRRSFGGGGRPVNR
jgi:hypothetical protein